MNPEALAWEAFAGRIGGTFKSAWMKGARVDGRIGHWPFTLDVMDAWDEPTDPGTRMRVFFPRKASFTCLIYPNHPPLPFPFTQSAIDKFQAVPSGDPAFDEVFVVRTHHPSQASLFIGNPDIRNLMLQAPRPYDLAIMESETWFLKSTPRDVDILRLTTADGIVTDAAELDKHFSLLDVCIRHLCDIGIALPRDPFVQP